ncbi:MAG: hypothetical protein JWM86_1176 [Thermoleophilia bacterium]|nr:hypothetical protein [Thermoleophilia bacterium]
MQTPDPDDAGFIVPPGTTPTIHGPVGGPMQLVLHGSRTGGRFSALENVVGPGQGPPLHSHDAQDEAWFVLEGTLRFRIGDDVNDAPRGSWAFVPRGTPHCFQNIGEAPARIAVMFTPSGMEPFFEAFADLAPDEAGPDAFQRLGEPVGMRIHGPQLAVSHPR